MNLYKFSIFIILILFIFYFCNIILEDVYLFDNGNNNSNIENLDYIPIKNSHKIKRWLYWRTFEINNISYKDFKQYWNHEHTFKSAFKSQFKDFYSNPFKYIDDFVENKSKRYWREKDEMAKEFEDYYYKNYGLKGIRHRLTPNDIINLLLKKNNK